MSHSPPLLIDTSVMIEAHRRYYAFDFCPGFWDALVHFGKVGAVASVDKVAAELARGDTDCPLRKWAAGAPSGFFLATGSMPIVQAYASISVWVHGHGQYLEAAKRDFLDGADSWLIAFAMVHGNTLVSQEVLAPEAKKKLPIPNVCSEFNVPVLDSFQMLREQKASFHFAARN